MGESAQYLLLCAQIALAKCVWNMTSLVNPAISFLNQDRPDKTNIANPISIDNPLCTTDRSMMSDQRLQYAGAKQDIRVGVAMPESMRGFDFLAAQLRVKLEAPLPVVRLRL